MCADTISTEVGLLSKTDPRLITHLGRHVPAGTSGGVTILGELGAVTGAAIIGGPAWLLAGVGLLPSHLTYQLLVIAIGAGMVGSLVDSLFGATIQGIFKCSVCGKITEKAKHCGEKSIYQKGIAFFENNMVNFTAAAAGGFFAMGIYFLF
jgi:uncharacterized membrane protein